MTIPRRSDPTAVIARLHQAQNQHDVDAFVACFAADYQSVRPMSPDHTISDQDYVRTNWSSIFQAIPDFRSDMLRVYATGDTIWTEWLWHGTLATGSRFDWHGITIFGIHDNHIMWGHLYMEPA
jgi:hypothetical protein